MPYQFVLEFPGFRAPEADEFVLTCADDGFTVGTDINTQHILRVCREHWGCLEEFYQLSRLYVPVCDSVILAATDERCAIRAKTQAINISRVVLKGADKRVRLCVPQEHLLVPPRACENIAIRTKRERIDTVLMCGESRNEFPGFRVPQGHRAIDTAPCEYFAIRTEHGYHGVSGGARCEQIECLPGFRIVYPNPEGARHSDPRPIG